MGAEQVQGHGGVAEVVEGLSEQDPLARGGGLPLLAVAPGPETHVHPAVDVRARHFQQAHFGVVVLGVIQCAQRRLDVFGELVEHVFPAGGVEQELRSEPFALEKSLEEAEQHEWTRRLDVDGAFRPAWRRAHLDPNGIPRANRNQLTGERIVQAYLTHGVRLQVDPTSQLKICPQICSFSE